MEFHEAKADNSKQGKRKISVWIIKRLVLKADSEFEREYFKVQMKRLMIDLKAVTVPSNSSGKTEKGVVNFAY